MCRANPVLYCFTNSRPESWNSLSGYSNPSASPASTQPSFFSLNSRPTLKAKCFSVRNVSPFLSTVLTEAYHWIIAHNTLFAQTLKTGSRELPPPASGMSQRSGCLVRGCWEATSCLLSTLGNSLQAGGRFLEPSTSMQKETPGGKSQERNPAILTYGKLSQ